MRAIACLQWLRGWLFSFFGISSFAWLPHSWHSPFAVDEVCACKQSIHLGGKELDDANVCGRWWLHWGFLSWSTSNQDSYGEVEKFEDEKEEDKNQPLSYRGQKRAEKQKQSGPLLVPSLARSRVLEKVENPLCLVLASILLTTLLFSVTTCFGRKTWQFVQPSDYTKQLRKKCPSRSKQKMNIPLKVYLGTQLWSSGKQSYV